MKTVNIKGPGIKAVLFDIGGVLINDIDPPIFEEVAGVFGVTPEQARKAISASEDGLQRGTMTEHDLWKKVAEFLGKKQPPVKTKTLWTDAIRKYTKINKDAVKIAESLRKAGYRTGIISNIEPSHAAYLREIRLFSGFEPVILSCEVGLRKPEKEIFQLALEKLGFQAGQVAFTDNNEGKIAGAKKLGMLTYLFDNAAGFANWLRKSGVRL